MHSSRKLDEITQRLLEDVQRRKDMRKQAQDEKMLVDMTKEKEVYTFQPNNDKKRKLSEKRSLGEFLKEQEQFMLQKHIHVVRAQEEMLRVEQSSRLQSRHVKTRKEEEEGRNVHERLYTQKKAVKQPEQSAKSVRQHFTSVGEQQEHVAKMLNPARKERKKAEVGNTQNMEQVK